MTRCKALIRAMRELTKQKHRAASARNNKQGHFYRTKVIRRIFEREGSSTMTRKRKDKLKGYKEYDNQQKTLDAKP